MQTRENSVPQRAAPRLWILQSPHSGDNTQLRALAAALDWPEEVKRLVYRPHEGVLRLFSLASLKGVDLARSSQLDPPWPDLVICSGRGAEAVCFWLKRQNPKLRIVFIGSPWSDLSRFDLVITTPQYRLPGAPNVLHNALPLHDVTSERLAAEAARLEASVAHLPRPFTAVLVGGSSGPYLFTPEGAQRLGRAASRIAAARGGSLLVTTSARTGKAAAEALARAIDVPHMLYRWQGPSDDNPFHGFLGLSEEIVVTADSVSMLAEACATGRPVHLFDIEEGRFAMRAEQSGPDGTLPPIGWRGRNLETTLFRFLINHLPPRFSRDLRIFHQALTASGKASWLADDTVPSPRPPRTAEANAELAQSVARIRALFGL